MKKRISIGTLDNMNTNIMEMLVGLVDIRNKNRVHKTQH